MHHICLFHFIYISGTEGLISILRDSANAMVLLVLRKGKMSCHGDSINILWRAEYIWISPSRLFFFFTTTCSAILHNTRFDWWQGLPDRDQPILHARVYISIIHTRVVEIRNQQTTKVCLFLWNFAQNSLISNTSSLAYSSFSSVFVSFHLAHPRR